MKLILSGGGSIISRKDKIYTRKLNEYIAQQGTTLLFISAASNDAPQYIETVKQVFSTVNVKTLLVSDYARARELIEWSDIIYLGGGDTRKLLDFLEKISFSSLIKKCHCIVGFSAGAIALCKQGYSLERNKLFSGFNLIPYTVIPHAKDFSDTFENSLPFKDGESIVFEDTVVKTRILDS